MGKISTFFDLGDGQKVAGRRAVRRERSNVALLRLVLDELIQINLHHILVGVIPKCYRIRVDFGFACV